MLNLQPYENPQYFVYLIIALLPVIIGMFKGFRMHWYESIFSLVFLVLIFDADKWPQGKALLGYVVFNLLLVYAYFKYRTREGSKNSTAVFYLSVALGIAQLAVVKFTPLFQHHGSILGFLGISYLTFRVVGTIMEIRDGSIKDLNMWKFIQFLLFFPTISSGPIDRYRRFVKDYDRVPDPEHYAQLVTKAIHYLMLGFLYKFILGYIFGTLWLPSVEHMAMASRGGAFLGLSWPVVGVMYAYSGYLFFDFAGYSLFAVAISYLMGIETPMNFNKPFLSIDIKDFWNRWHITLSTWLRDFVFSRVFMEATKKKRFKKRLNTAMYAYMVNMLLMGFWHGLTISYSVYGAYHGILMAGFEYYQKKSKFYKKNKNKAWYKVCSWFITINLVIFGLYIFSGEPYKMLMTLLNK